MKKAYIIHGFESAPHRNWFGWLQSELNARKFSAHIPELPNPNTPLPHEWLEFLKREIRDIDENTYFIAHSLGCLGALQFLQTIPNDKIGGYILVSGFDEGLETIPQLSIFSDIKLDYKKLISLCKNRVIISARDDEITPTHLSHALSMRLEATFIQTAHGNHFMQEDGFTQNPLVLRTLLSFLEADSQN